MKINKIITLNNSEFKNSFFLTLFFKEEKPYLKIKNTDVILPISSSLIIESFSKFSIIENNIIQEISLVQNEANDIIKLVNKKSEEYKKIIRKNSFRTDNLKQGTLVELQSGEKLIFIKLIKQSKTKDFISILKNIEYKIPVSKKDFLQIFKNYNLFYSPEESKLYLYKTEEIDKKVISCYSVFPEFSELRFSAEEQLKLGKIKNGYLKDLSFSKKRNEHFIIKEIGNEENLNIRDKLYSAYCNVIVFNSTDFNSFYDCIQKM